jgi:GNAT superfamily N-acetyltransferase
VSVTVRPLEEEDRAWARALISDTWGVPVVSLSRSYEDPAELTGFVAEDEGARRVGMATYRAEPDECEVVTLIAVERRRGVGRMLLEAVRNDANEQGCARLWLMTTDDNPDALAFYEHVGWVEVARHPEFDAVVRQAKPDLANSFAAVEFEWR